MLDTGHSAGDRFYTLAVSILIIVSGLGLAVPGVYLFSLGGSFYYAAAGILVFLSGALILLHKRSGTYLYWSVFFCTIIWSVSEVGFYGWGLMPRLVYLAVIGLLLLLPPIDRVLKPVRPNTLIGPGLKLSSGLIAVTLLLSFLVVPDRSPRTISAGPEVREWQSPPQDGSDDGQWLHYGRTSGGTRYSPLQQIDTDNVGSLELAWEYRTGLYLPGSTRRRAGLQMTPLMVGGRVLGCTGFNSVFALDPVTGEEIWRYDPGFDDSIDGQSACRGVAYHRSTETLAQCSERVLVGTMANELIAIDAANGTLCSEFGDDGRVDLGDGLGDFPSGWTHPTSPPVVVNGVAVIGAFVRDNQSTIVPSGVVRGYDVLTGDFRWAFDSGLPEYQGMPEPGASFTVASPNAWAPFSADEELGLVYLPMGNSSPDFFGGHRSDDARRFSSSVVAVDAGSGEVRWSFQAIRHDLWDYDIAAQPVLAEFPVDGRRVPAVILATKTGQVFVLDRRTGEALTEVEERPVPVSDVPGETPALTQPYSTGMPDFSGRDLTEVDMWGLTPYDQLYCRIKFRQARYEGMFTPPRLGPSIRYPGELGGIGWGSVSVDDHSGIMIVNSNHMANYNRLISREQADIEGLVPRIDRDTHYPPGAAMEGTPYGVHWEPFMSGLDVPCQMPPYGYLAAVDLDAREILWRRPLGNARGSGPFGISLGLPLPLGAPNIGGSVITAGDLVFVAATQDEVFRAFDLRTGELLWQDNLPAAGHATPMTYRGRDGHQYILIAAGGQSLRNRPGDSILAYRLPD